MSTTVPSIETAATPVTAPAEGSSRAPDRRRELARGAYQLIAERGVDGLSLRALARRFGATTGLVSHHFVDRSELVAAALDHARQIVLDRIVALGTTDPHPFDVLATVLPTDAPMVEQWRFAFSIRTAALFDRGLATIDDAINATWHTQLPRSLAGHVAGDPADAAGHLVALVDGIALQSVLHPGQWPASRQREVLRLGYDAVAAGPSHPQPHTQPPTREGAPT